MENQNGKSYSIDRSKGYPVVIDNETGEEVPMFGQPEFYDNIVVADEPLTNWDPKVKANAADIGQALILSGLSSVQLYTERIKPLLDALTDIQMMMDCPRASNRATKALSDFFTA